MAKIHEIDNSVDLTRCITWQYDHAGNLVALLYSWRDFFTASTQDFWDANAKFVFNLDNAGRSDDPEGESWDAEEWNESQGESGADPFCGLGLNLIGLMLGVPRPSVTVGGVTRQLSTAVYRRLLKGHAVLCHSNGSTAELNRFLATVFGAGKVSVADGGCVPDMGNMAISYEDEGLVEGTDEYALYYQHPELVKIRPCGVDCNIAPTDPAGIIGLMNESTGESGQDDNGEVNLAMTQNQENGGVWSEN